MDSLLLILDYVWLQSLLFALSHGTLAPSDKHETIKRRQIDAFPNKECCPEEKNTDKEDGRKHFFPLLNTIPTINCGRPGLIRGINQNSFCGSTLPRQDEFTMVVKLVSDCGNMKTTCLGIHRQVYTVECTSNVQMTEQLFINEDLFPTTAQILVMNNQKQCTSESHFCARGKRGCFLLQQRRKIVCPKDISSFFTMYVAPRGIAIPKEVMMNYLNYPIMNILHTNEMKSECMLVDRKVEYSSCSGELSNSFHVEQMGFLNQVQVVKSLPSSLAEYVVVPKSGLCFYFKKLHTTNCNNSKKNIIQVMDFASPTTNKIQTHDFFTSGIATPSIHRELPFIQIIDYNTKKASCAKLHPKFYVTECPHILHNPHNLYEETIANIIERAEYKLPVGLDPLNSDKYVLAKGKSKCFLFEKTSPVSCDQVNGKAILLDTGSNQFASSTTDLVYKNEYEEIEEVKKVISLLVIDETGKPVITCKQVENVVRVWACCEVTNTNQYQFLQYSIPIGFQLAYSKSTSIKCEHILVNHRSSCYCFQSMGEVTCPADILNILTVYRVQFEFTQVYIDRIRKYALTEISPLQNMLTTTVESTSKNIASLVEINSFGKPNIVCTFIEPSAIVVPCISYPRHYTFSEGAFPSGFKIISNPISIWQENFITARLQNSCYMLKTSGVTTCAPVINNSLNLFRVHPFIFSKGHVENILQKYSKFRGTTWAVEAMQKSPLFWILSYQQESEQSVYVEKKEETLPLRIVHLEKEKVTEQDCKLASKNVLATSCPINTKNLFYLEESDLVRSTEFSTQHRIHPASTLMPNAQSIVYGRGLSSCYEFQLINSTSCPAKVKNGLTMRHYPVPLYAYYNQDGSIPSAGTLLPFHKDIKCPLFECLPVIFKDQDEQTLTCRTVYKVIIKCDCPAKIKPAYIIKTLQFPAYAKFVSQTVVNELLDSRTILARGPNSCYVFMDTGYSVCDIQEQMTEFHRIRPETSVTYLETITKQNIVPSWSQDIIKISAEAPTKILLDYVTLRIFHKADRNYYCFLVYRKVPYYSCSENMYAIHMDASTSLQELQLISLQPLFPLRYIIVKQFSKCYYFKKLRYVQCSQNEQYAINVVSMSNFIQDVLDLPDHIVAPTLDENSISYLQNKC